MEHLKLKFELNKACRPALRNVSCIHSVVCDEKIVYYTLLYNNAFEFLSLNVLVNFLCQWLGQSCRLQVYINVPVLALHLFSMQPIYCRWWGSWSQSQLREAGYTLDWSPIYHKANTEANNHIAYSNTLF